MPSGDPEFARPADRVIEGFVLFVLDLFAGLGECPLRVALRVFGGLCDQLPWAEALALTSIPPPGA